MLDAREVGAGQDGIVQGRPVQVELNDIGVAEVGAPHAGAAVHLDVSEVGPYELRVVGVEFGPIVSTTKGSATPTPRRARDSLL